MRNGPYELIVAPEDYPGKRYRGRYAYEHHVVWWLKTGDLIPDGWVIHHKNEDKRDNRFRNLELKTVAVHTSEHQKPAEMQILKCTWCKEKFEKPVRYVKSKKKQGQKRFYCCRSHQVSDQQKRRKSIRGSSVGS